MAFHGNLSVEEGVGLAKLIIIIRKNVLFIITIISVMGSSINISRIVVMVIVMVVVALTVIRIPEFLLS